MFTQEPGTCLNPGWRLEGRDAGGRALGGQVVKRAHWLGSKPPRSWALGNAGSRVLQAPVRGDSACVELGTSAEGGPGVCRGPTWGRSWRDAWRKGQVSSGPSCQLCFVA